MDPDYLRELFASFRAVTVRRLFRGAGIYVDDVMFALWSSGGTLYLKVDESNEPDFVREGLPPFEYERNGIKRAMASYRKMPDRLYDDPEELAQWAAKALAAAVRKALPRQKSVTPKRKPKAKAARKKTKRLTKR